MIRLAKAIWYVLTLRCEEADRIRSRRRDEAELRWHERTGERLHNLLCRSCRAARRQLDILSNVVSANRERLAAGPPEPLSEDARRVIAARLREEQERSG